MTAEPNPAVDWEQVERDYRAGLVSVYEIGRRVGLTEGAVRKRARRDGWQRALCPQVQSRVREQVIRTAAQDDNASPRIRTGADDEAVIVAAAQVGARAVKGHLARAARLAAIAEAQMGLIEQWLRADDVEREKLRVVLFPTKGDSLQATARAAADLVDRSTKLERVGLSLDDTSEQGKNQFSSLSDEELRELIVAKLRHISNPGVVG